MLFAPVEGALPPAVDFAHLAGPFRTDAVPARCFPRVASFWADRSPGSPQSLSVELRWGVPSVVEREFCSIEENTVDLLLG